MTTARWVCRTMNGPGYLRKCSEVARRDSLPLHRFIVTLPQFFLGVADRNDFYT